MEHNQETEITAILAIIFAFVFPLVGLILAIIARNKIKNDPSKGGKGLVNAALIISIILIALLFLLILIGAIAYFGALNPVVFVPTG